MQPGAPAAPDRSEPAARNEFTVRVAGRDGGWEVQIVAPGGDVLLTRACSTETEARTFASTVQQHIYWLSPAKFVEYYRLEAGE
jgi:hypothetical protein